MRFRLVQLGGYQKKILLAKVGQASNRWEPVTDLRHLSGNRR